MLGKFRKRLPRTILTSIIAINGATEIIRHLYSISTTSAAEYSDAASPLVASARNKPESYLLALTWFIIISSF